VLVLALVSVSVSVSVSVLVLVLVLCRCGCGCRRCGRRGRDWGYDAIGVGAARRNQTERDDRTGDDDTHDVSSIPYV